MFNNTDINDIPTVYIQITLEYCIKTFLLHICKLPPLHIQNDDFDGCFECEKRTSLRILNMQRCKTPSLSAVLNDKDGRLCAFEMRKCVNQNSMTNIENLQTCLNKLKNKYFMEKNIQNYVGGFLFHLTEIVDIMKNKPSLLELLNGNYKPPLKQIVNEKFMDGFIINLKTYEYLKDSHYSKNTNIQTYNREFMIDFIFFFMSVGMDDIYLTHNNNNENINITNHNK